MENEQTPDSVDFLTSLRYGIWILGITAWLFGITDRSIAALADQYLSAIDIVQLFTASFFLVSWLFLKPTQKLKNGDASN